MTSVKVDGHTFFTMEYGMVKIWHRCLRRIGRLPQDKALDIARQLCAGLAAAHAKGVLHRDLNRQHHARWPRTGSHDRFRPRWTHGKFKARISAAAHPPTWRPNNSQERKSRRRATCIRWAWSSTKFSPASARYGEALTAIVRGGEASAPSKPSSVVKDLDPAIERVILRCLEPESQSRPLSALSVAGALPGGDPLAAALAAGETPRPEMVAAAGGTTGLAPKLRSHV